MDENAEGFESAAGAEGGEGAAGAVRERLHRGLGQLSTGFAPVEAAMRQGHRMRTRRRAVAGGSLALALAVAAGAVALGVAHRPTKAAPVRHNVRHVMSVTPGSVRGDGVGTIAAGVLDGMAWTVFVGPQGGPDDCTFGFDPERGIRTFYDATCALLRKPDSVGSPAILRTVGTMADSAYVEVGTLQPDVTSVDIEFGDGEVLRFVPVPVAGAGYIAFPKPMDVDLVRVTTRSPSGDRYAVPYNNASGSFGWQAWYDVGQPAPPAQDPKPIPGVGKVRDRWSLEVVTGPWGRCLAGTGSFSPVLSCAVFDASPPDVLSGYVVGGVGQLCYGEVSQTVARVVFTDEAGHTVVDAPVAAVDGHVYVGVALRADFAGSVAFYDAEGHVLNSRQW